MKRFLVAIVMTAVLALPASAQLSPQTATLRQLGWLATPVSHS
jgi:hypothetical protein